MTVTKAGHSSAVFSDNKVDVLKVTSTTLAVVSQGEYMSLLWLKSHPDRWTVGVS